jgi:hypothetical protein
VSNVIFSSPTGYSTSKGKASEDLKSLDINVLALHNGTFTDMSGTEVEVTREVIHNLANVYNANVEKVLTAQREVFALKDNKRLEDMSINDFELEPNQINHDASDNLKTAGRIFGLMEVQEVKDKTYLFCNLRVKGRDNVERVLDNRFRDLSIQYDPETYETVEISWVVKGAAKNAMAILGKNEDNCDNNKILGLTSKVSLSTIRDMQTNLMRAKKDLRHFEDILQAKKRLISLCRTQKINYAQKTKLEKDLYKFSEPHLIVELLESIIEPKEAFTPKVISDKYNGDFEIIQELKKYDSLFRG